MSSAKLNKDIISPSEVHTGKKKKKKKIELEEATCKILIKRFYQTLLMENWEITDLKDNFGGVFFPD